MRKRMQKILALVMALAILITAVPALTPTAKATSYEGWVERDGVRYYLADGHRVYGWQFIDGRAYYFNENGAEASLWGIDVSEFQSIIDWPTVAASGCKFAILRIGYRGGTSGAIFEDAYFDRNMREAAAAGIPVGVYFYSQAISVKEAEEEAEYVIDRLADYDTDVQYPVYIDIESMTGGSRVSRANLSRRTYTDIALAFCRKVEDAGLTPGVYSYQSLLMNSLYADEFEANGYDTWYAYYSSTVESYPYDFTIWQYSGTPWGRVNGISSSVDLDATLVDYAGRYPDLATRGSREVLPGEYAVSYTADPSFPVNPATNGHTAGDISSYPSLARTDSGIYVYKLQCWLRELGYYNGSMDEYYGNGTYNAVLEFQKDYGLTADGAVGQQTWKKLINEALSARQEFNVTTPAEGKVKPEETDDGSDDDTSGGGSSTNPNPGTSSTIVDVSGFPTITYGDNNEAVKTLQTWLNAIGYQCGSVDGYFGAVTYSQVRRFQQACGLTVDGVVGQQTWTALAEMVAGKPTSGGGIGSSQPEPEEKPETGSGTSTEDVSSFPSVSYGDDSSAVKTLQTWLNSLGYDCGNPDGSFGNRTLTAVKAFQQANGLYVDGIVGRKTWQALADARAGAGGKTQQPEEPEEEASRSESSATDYTRFDSLSYGSSGSEVRTLQEKLNSLGFSCGNPDGSFGYMTRNAVIRYQQAYGLYADGIVGPKTWKSLYS